MEAARYLAARDEVWGSSLRADFPGLSPLSALSLGFRLDR
jgi:hypothetical protein